MHRPLIILMLLLIAQQTSFAQLLQQENLYHNNLNGKVKAFTETNTSKIPAAGVLINQTVTFNRDGNIAKLEVYDASGLSLVRDYKYTNQGYSYVSKWKKRVKGADTWVTGTPRVYSFDERKHVEKTQGGDLPTDIGHYNEMGETTQISTYSTSGKLIEKVVHGYDDGGHIVETHIFNPNGKLRERCRFQLKINGRNKVLEQRFDGTNKLTYECKRKYDQYCNVLEQRELADGETTVSRFIYRYDKENNWIHREQFKGEGKLARVTERKIVYY